MQKWLARLVSWTLSYRAINELGWDGGMFAYDELADYRISKVQNYDSFLYFAELCDLLVAELKAAQSLT